MSIVAFLVDAYDREVVKKEGKLKPTIIVKALAIALKEL